MQVSRAVARLTVNRASAHLQIHLTSWKCSSVPYQIYNTMIEVSDQNELVIKNSQVRTGRPCHFELLLTTSAEATAIEPTAAETTAAKSQRPLR